MINNLITKNDLHATLCLTLPLVLILVTNSACLSQDRAVWHHAVTNTPNSKGQVARERQPSTRPTSLGYPQLLDRHRWVVAEDHRVLKTEDGGHTWSNIYSIKSPTESKYRIRGLCFVDSQVGYLIVGGRLFGGYLLHTNNGGETWEEVGIIKSESDRVSFETCFFVDNSHGWAVGLSWPGGWGGTDERTPAYVGTVFATQDGGRTWERQLLNLPNNYLPDGTRWSIRDVLFTDINTGWLVGDAGVIFRTADGGQKWSLAKAENVDYQSVNFLNNQFGYATNRYGNSSWGVAITSDGGQQWKLLNESFVHGTWPVSAVFVTPDHGFAVSLKLYETTDRGKRWKGRTGNNNIALLKYFTRLSWQVCGITPSSCEVLKDSG